MKLSIGKAWEEAAAFLAREGRLVAPVALALFAIPSALINWAYPAGSVTAAGGRNSLALLLVILIMMAGQMTIIVLASGWHGRVGEALGKASRRVPTLVGAALIVFGPLLVIFSIALAAALMAAGINDPATLTPEAMMKVPGVAWLTLLMLVVLLFLAVRMFPMSAVAANETVGPIALLKRSWALTRGKFGRLLALMLLLVVTALVLSYAVSVVVGSIAVLTLGEPRPFNVPALIIALAGGFVSALISSVSAAMIARIYAQLSDDTAA
ncbi:MAG: hypothetical protein ABIR87_05675 [Sphingomicrobium sp.]